MWVSNSTYRHTSYAATCANYARLHWFNDRTLVLPLSSDKPVLYLFDYTNPLDPLLARYLPPGTLQHRDLGPDGKTGFFVLFRERADLSPAYQIQDWDLRGRFVYDTLTATAEPGWTFDGWSGDVSVRGRFFWGVLIG